MYELDPMWDVQAAGVLEKKDLPTCGVSSWVGKRDQSESLAGSREKKHGNRCVGGPP